MNTISLRDKTHVSAGYLNTLRYFRGGAIDWGTELQAGASRFWSPMV